MAASERCTAGVAINVSISSFLCSRQGLRTLIFRDSRKKRSRQIAIPGTARSFTFSSGEFQGFPADAALDVLVRSKTSLDPTSESMTADLRIAAVSGAVPH